MVINKYYVGELVTFLDEENKPILGMVSSQPHQYWDGAYEILIGRDRRASKRYHELTKKNTTNNRLFAGDIVVCVDNPLEFDITVGKEYEIFDDNEDRILTINTDRGYRHRLIPHFFRLKVECKCLAEIRAEIKRYMESKDHWYTKEG